MTDNIIPISINQPIITTVKTHLEVTCDPAFDEAWINGVRYVPTPEGPAVTPDPAPTADRDCYLWEDMRNARLARDPAIWHERDSIAAELRVVADWLERRWPQGPDMRPCACAAWLRAEAERAVEGVQ